MSELYLELSGSYLGWKYSAICLGNNPKEPSISLIKEEDNILEKLVYALEGCDPIEISGPDWMLVSDDPLEYAWVMYALGDPTDG